MMDRLRASLRLFEKDTIGGGDLVRGPSSPAVWLPREYVYNGTKNLEGSCDDSTIEWSRLYTLRSVSRDGAIDRLSPLHRFTTETLAKIKKWSR